MEDKGVKVRFAPSPTGYLHLGGARTALYNWLFAKHCNGDFILRIEDTDRSRFVPDSVDDLLEGLRWLGIEPTEGPFYQSERREMYAKAAEKLLETGAAYRCFCTPERLATVREQRKKAGLKQGYDRHCRNLSQEEIAERLDRGDKYVVRLKMPLSGQTSFTDRLRGEITYDNTQLEDIILLKSDGWPTYHLANVVDDHHMGITHILRADEWLPSVPYHVVLYKALGWEPPEFVHLPVILSPDGKGKMSKRYGAFAVRELRAEGYLPEAVVNYLALLGWSPGDDREIMSLEEMAQVFDIDRISKRGAVFDYDKLRWMNGQYMKAMPEEELTQRARPFFNELGVHDQQLISRIVALFKDRSRTIKQMAEQSSYFWKEPEEYDPKGVKKHFKPDAASRLLAAADALEGLGDWSEPEIEKVVRSAAEELGVSAGKLIHPIRLAISGTTVGPSLFALMEALGKQTCLRRINRAIEWIENNIKASEAADHEQV